ncbi:MAG: hypothetical protein K0R29_392 [Pseudobdellovibrio sp.]|jgi:uncharacterized protein YecE (DUF72 family)|nr:hypothetical protein [Pseudobdellovibrio sp.]
MSEIRIGISGWTYPPWRKTFYPEKLAQKNELEFASRAVSTIEINGTFYSTQLPQTFVHWYERTPADFKFSVKASRYITHIKRIKEADKEIKRFTEGGLRELKEKLGPILWQFPPNMKFDEDRFKKFFKILPKDLRHAVEIRNDSFKDERYIELLRKYNVAYVIADTANRWVYAEDLTADFVYVRLHGFKELYTGGYTLPALKKWKEKFLCWQAGNTADRPVLIADHIKGRSKKKDMFIYFDNDAKVNAPFDAAALASLLENENSLVLPEIDPRETLKRKKGLNKRILLRLQDRAIKRKITGS